MNMQVCFFDDTNASCLMPLTLTRPAHMLRSGILLICEKWQKYLSVSKSSSLLPPYMKGVYESAPISGESDCIWINGRFLPDHLVVTDILKLKTGEGLTSRGTPVAIRADGKLSSSLYESGKYPESGIEFSPTDGGTLLKAPWMIFSVNGEQIQQDISLTKPKAYRVDPDRYPGVHFLNTAEIFVMDGVRIEPGSVISAADGPVFLDSSAWVMAGSLVQGPFYLGRHSVLKLGAKVYGNSSLGPYCKVGGEINNVVFQAYSNKGHDGFLGNSAVGEWCNFGADTNNSNLKNNYSTVRLADWNSRKEYDTGLQFCGTIMGDHSKTAINTMLNTGTVCGVFANIFCGTFPPKLIPSFSWLGPDKTETYRFDKAMEAAKRMMDRRGVEMSEAYVDMLRHIFENKPPQIS
ncbi:MAG: hypothetical protein LAT67_01605 [Balneolales bacterium]|nr:hypothetical protein [Balneolales bacterium]